MQKPSTRATAPQSSARLRQKGEKLPALRERLARIGLQSDWDYVLHLPLRYEDETAITPVASLVAGVPAQVEGEIIDQIQESLGWADGIVINPGAYTHTSIAIADALRAIEIPTVEVHLSDTDKREDFRKISYVEAVAVKTIKGKGFEGYKEAIDFLAEEWKKADI